MNHRVPGLAQRLCCRFHVLGIPLSQYRLDGLVEEVFLRNVLQSDIGGYLHHYRSRPALAESGEGAAHHLGGPVGYINLLDVLVNAVVVPH